MCSCEYYTPLTISLGYVLFIALCIWKLWVVDIGYSDDVVSVLVMIVTSILL